MSVITTGSCGLFVTRQSALSFAVGVQEMLPCCESTLALSMKGLLISASFGISKTNVLGTFSLIVYVVHKGAAYAPVAASSRIAPNSGLTVCITCPFLSGILGPV